MSDAMRRRRRVLIGIGLVLVALVTLERCARFEQRSEHIGFVLPARADTLPDDVAPDGLPVLSVAVLPGPGEADYARAVAAQTGVRPVSRPEDAVLLLDPVSRNALDSSYDVIAAVPEPARDVPVVVASARAVESFRRHGLGAGPKVDFSSYDEIQPSGAHLEFDVAAPPAHLTVFAVTASGTVEALWPLSSDDPDPWPGDRPFRIAVTVTPPFGADTLVAVSSDTVPEGLRASLSNDARTPASVHAALAELLATDAGAGVGVRSFFTGDAPKN